ncbi:MAG: ABC transporter substrate-binding protein [Acidobacteria bacterium]|nr:ABC transporter substrate-binding protein [Acidobacteriota bacterium]
MIIESPPANLDLRIGTDAQSERIGELIFDSLLRRDAHYRLQPHLAERWEVPDPLTYVFHLRRGVKFHDGRPLRARDVKWTFDSLLEGAVRSPKASTFRFVERIDTPDDWTVIFRLKEPYATLPWNLSGGAIGIVPSGSKVEAKEKPIGSGPFRFVSLAQDREVIIERNDEYWGEKPKLRRVRFAVVPDTTTRVLELRKRSADLVINALTADMVEDIRREGRLMVVQAPGSIYSYLALNLNDPILKDGDVRRALAYAIDRRPVLHYLWRDQARPAASLLPPEHWAYDAGVATYDYDPERARRLLDESGYPMRDGVRFHLTMKTSTEETTRLLAAVLQQQLREVGIALDIRSYEFATFYSDVVRGAFQLYSLRWIGGNEDPDIFEHVFHSASIPPKRANRGHYRNPRVDELIDQARREVDTDKRRTLYAEVQRLIAEDLPYIHLWYLDNVVVHSPRVRGIRVSPSGNYEFLRTAELAP